MFFMKKILNPYIVDVSGVTHLSRQEMRQLENELKRYYGLEGCEIYGS